MHPQVKKLLYLFFILILVAVVLPVGCSRMKEKWRQVSGTRAPDSDLEGEAMAPPEAKQEEVVIDGKTWVRSRNPYYLLIPNEPEYIYAEKGKELITAKQFILAGLAKQFGLETKSKESKGIPPEKVQEMVQKEVDRLLREQGLRALYSQGQGKPYGVMGRYVAVYPAPESIRSLEGPNYALSTTLSEYLSRQKGVKIASPDRVRAVLSKAQVMTGGTLTNHQTLQALGDTTGVQALILTRVVPATGRNPNFLVLEVYDTFKGTKIDGIAYPVEGTPDLLAIQNFVRSNALRLAAALVEVDWFGRVEFVKEGNVYLNLGDSAGLKVGDRLKVVTPGQEVVNPNTHALLGFTSDQSQGELKITELLGSTGAVAQVVSGGPFKSNDKVKALR
jgi:hypothetical protein